jgi:hypothetical protein
MQIIDGTSHMDHGLGLGHTTWLKELFKDRTGFFKATIKMPSDLRKLPCGLWGPAMKDPAVEEDKVTYAIRGNRRWASRKIMGVSTRPTDLLTVIAGPACGQTCVLYTAYAGPEAPREPGDLTIPDWASIEESRKFWATHALVF